MSTVLAFDPGDVTGWSIWHYDETTPIHRVEYGLIKGGVETFVFWIDIMGAIWEMDDWTIVCEKYVPDGRKADPKLNTKLIEGALWMFVQAKGLEPVVWQENLFKRQVDDQVLKDHALWLTGREPSIGHTDGRDVNDTALHALAWAKLRDHQPTVAMYWPDE